LQKNFQSLQLCSTFSSLLAQNLFFFLFVKGIHSRPNPQHLQQQQLLGEPSGDVGHGGSLPDVKFASNKSINLQVIRMIL
jgi:hypothetical protein